MEIGTERPVITIEPLESPVPGKEIEAPPEPERVPEETPSEKPEREKVPA